MSDIVATLVLWLFIIFGATSMLVLLFGRLFLHASWRTTCKWYARVVTENVLTEILALVLLVGTIVLAGQLFSV